jgi:hypothetical protein
VLTLTLFLAVLFRRVTNRVMRLLSNFDDYFSWFITMLVMVTGIGRHGPCGRPLRDAACAAHLERRCASDLVSLRQTHARILYFSVARDQRRATRSQRSYLVNEVAVESPAPEQMLPGP